MNVSGSALAGDQVDIGIADGPGAILTATLSHKAVMAADLEGESVGTFNLSQNSTLNLSLTSGALVGVDSAAINISGNDNLMLNDTGSDVTVNLGSDAKLSGTFNMGPFHGETFGNLTVNGGTGSAFKNHGISVVVNTEQATINADVIGKGSFVVANQGGFLPGESSRAKMEFGASVGSNQSVTDSGLIIIDKPDQFSAKVTFLTSQATPLLPFPAEIDLIGLATADSYTYRNDMLSIYSGKSVIDRLRLTDDTPYGFAVEKTAGSVNIVAISDPTSPPIGLPKHINV
jgi:hypothetical protein